MGAVKVTVTGSPTSSPSGSPTLTPTGTGSPTPTATGTGSPTPTGTVTGSPTPDTVGTEAVRHEGFGRRDERWPSHDLPFVERVRPDLVLCLALIHHLAISESIPLDGAAPLLCAGITTYSPLKHFGLEEGDKLGVVGLGGLGHMAVKFGHAMGAHVTVLSHSPGKRQDALALGADDFLVTNDEAVFKENAGRFDFIIDTVSATHDYNAYLNLIRRDGIMVLVGAPDPTPLSAFPLLMKRRNRQRWTPEDKVQLGLQLRRLSRLSPYLVVLVMPGGFFLLPALAWWLDRRRNRLRTSSV